MGFGMKKEVYTRKPKQAFKRTKPSLEPKAKQGDGSGYKASKAYHDNQFKQIRDRKWFKVLSLIATLLLLCFVVEIFLIDDIKYWRAAHLFEKRGIETYYEDHKKDIDQLISFIENKEDKIASIRSGNMLLRSENFFDSLKGRNPKSHHVGRDYYGRMLPSEVVQGNIRFKKHDRYTTSKQYWTLDVQTFYLENLHPSILEHLNTDYEEVNSILDFISKQKFELHTNRQGLIITFTKYHKPYTLLVCKKPEQIKQRITKELVQLNDHLYYVKAKLKPGLFIKTKDNSSISTQNGH